MFSADIRKTSFSLQVFLDRGFLFFLCKNLSCFSRRETCLPECLINMNPALDRRFICTQQVGGFSLRCLSFQYALYYSYLDFCWKLLFVHKITPHTVNTAFVFFLCLLYGDHISAAVYTQSVTSSGFS